MAFGRLRSTSYPAIRRRVTERENTSRHTLDARARLLRAALGFLSFESREPELRLLHNCFDPWRGIGDVVAEMARQKHDLELRRDNGRGWRAMFFLSGFEQSLADDAGVAHGHGVRGRRCSARHMTRSGSGTNEKRRRAIGLRLTTHRDDQGEL